MKRRHKKQISSDERGEVMFEMVLSAVLIAIVAIISVQFLGNETKRIFLLAALVDPAVADQMLEDSGKDPGLSPTEKESPVEAAGTPNNSPTEALPPTAFEPVMLLP